MTDTAAVRLCGSCVLIAALAASRSAGAAKEHTHDRFGAAVATDGVRAAVAAPGDNADGFDGGAVYMYVDDGAGWRLDQRIVPDEPMFEARFGTALALSGDTLAATASGSTGTGDVLIFRRGDDGWAQVSRVTTEIDPDQNYADRAIALSGGVLAVSSGLRAAGDVAAPAEIRVFHEEEGWRRVAALRGAPDADGEGEFGCGMRFAVVGDLLVCMQHSANWQGRGLSTHTSRVATFARTGDEWLPAGDLVLAPNLGVVNLAFDGTWLLALVLEVIGEEYPYTLINSVRAYRRTADGWSGGAEVVMFDAFEFPLDTTLAVGGGRLALIRNESSFAIELYREGGAGWALDGALAESEAGIGPAMAVGEALWVGTPGRASPTDPEALAIGEVVVHSLDDPFPEVARFSPEAPDVAASGCRVDRGARGAWLWLGLPALVAGRRRRR
jgi:hypothetical protein